MLKSVTKLIFIILLGLMASFFLLKSFSNIGNSLYKQILFTNKKDLGSFTALLETEKKYDYLSRKNVELPINTYIQVENLSLSDIENVIDFRDYRRTPFIESLEKLFSSNKGEIIYVAIGNETIINQFIFYLDLYRKGYDFTILDSSFYRDMFCLIVLFAATLIFAFGSKIRSVISIIALLSYIFIPKNDSYYFMLFLITVFFLIILLIENFSLSNRYIKRNNLGFIRVCIFVVLLLVPTVLPNIIDMEYSVLNSVFIDKELSYDSLGQSFNEKNPDVSNFFVHYAYQHGVLYGLKYLFPTYNSSVKINEFEGVDHSLTLATKNVVTFNDDFIKSFKDYIKTTATGKFYSSYNGSFYFEEKPLASLYIKDKEYIQISILAAILLLSFLLFKKKVVKY